MATVHLPPDFKELLQLLTLANPIDFWRRLRKLRRIKCKSASSNFRKREWPWPSIAARLSLSMKPRKSNRVAYSERWWLSSKMIRRYEEKDLNELLDAWYFASHVGHPFLDEDFFEQERRGNYKLSLITFQTTSFRITSPSQRIQNLCNRLGLRLGLQVA